MPTPNQLRELKDEFLEMCNTGGGAFIPSVVADYWIAKLEEAVKEAVEEGTKAGLMKALSFKIPKNPCSVDYADGFTACQTMCLNAAHSKDEKLSDK